MVPHDPSLTDAETQFYDKTLTGATEGPESTGYGRPVNQHVRFEAFRQALSKIDLPGDEDPRPYTLLDVGCGTGDLYAYLCGHHGHWLDEYVGVDRHEGMIKAANERFPERAFGQGPKFLKGNFAAELPDVLRGKKFDVVACIATLAMKPPEWSRAQTKTYVEHHIDVLAQQARRLFFITLFSNWKTSVESDEMVVDPADVFNSTLHMYERVELIHSYAPHDFALAIYPEEGRWWREWRLS